MSNKSRSDLPHPAQSATFTLRPFILADIEPVIELWRQCELIRPWNNPYLDIQRKLTTQPELFLVACLDGQIVGSAMIGYEGHRAWVYYLAVHPSYQKQGIGLALMQKAEQLLIDRDCPKIQLMVRKSNREAISFYEAQGYEVSDVLVLGKRLIED